MKDFQRRRGLRLHILSSPEGGALSPQDQELPCETSPGDRSDHSDPQTRQKTTAEQTFQAPSTAEPPPGALSYSEETAFSPEVWPEESGESSYRFRCPSSGSFRCSSTGLVFVVSKEAELRYRIVQWDEALLLSSGRTPAGPLYDIKCPEKAVCELHLPHCEPDNADLSRSQLSVAHISDCGLTLVDPRRTTRTHAVVSVSGLSVFGLVWRLLFEGRAVRGQVLFFRTPREQTRRKITVHVHLLPSNVPVDRVKGKKWSTNEYISAPSRCQLLIDHHYSLLCPSAELVQPERALFDMDNEPNFHPSFELWLGPDSSSVFISVREEGSSEERGVWSHHLNLNECSSSSPHCPSPPSLPSPPSDPETRLRSARRDFISRVTEPVLKQLLDLLLQEKVLSSEETETLGDRPRADRARLLLDSVLFKGSRAASVLIEGVCELDPCSELCERLKTQP